MRRVIVSSIFLPVLIIGLSCVNLCGAKAKWTFIVYSAEDNSAGSVFDKNQLTTAAVNSSDVNVIVLADENGAENTYIYKVQYDSNTFTVITPTLSVTSLLPAATTNELNTGDPATLVVFSTWAITNYPAEKY